MVHSFCFLFDVSGSECILVMQYLNAAFLCSIGWFEKKLIVLSVVLGFRNTSFSILVGFLIMSRSKTFICPLFSYVVLNFMSLCVWFMFVVIKVRMYSFRVIYNQNVIYVTHVERYVFDVDMFYMFTFEVF